MVHGMLSLCLLFVSPATVVPHIHATHFPHSNCALSDFVHFVRVIVIRWLSFRNWLVDFEMGIHTANAEKSK